MDTYQWLKSGDVGISSLTIFYVMTGLVTTTGLRSDGWFDIPYDPYDFGRCYRLLARFPEWRERLGEVAIVFPKWLPLVENWAELETLYLQEDRDMYSRKKLWLRMKELYSDCMIADQTYPNIVTENGRTIATVKNDGNGIPDNEVNSNARLIAAAPELLNALVMMCRQYLTFRDSDLMTHYFMSAGETALEVLEQLGVVEEVGNECYRFKTGAEPGE